LSSAESENAVNSKEASRIRDPERRQRILEAAAELIAQRGYVSVTLSEIGASAGIVGSGIYRYFDAKVSILVELFDRVVDSLVADAETMLRKSDDPELTLARLVRGQVEFTMGERALCQVYLQEARNLPERDLRRLKWKQRHYVDLWIDLLRTEHPDTSADQAQVLAHSAISSVHSCLKYHAHVDDAHLATMLEASACRILRIRPVAVDRLVPLTTAEGARGDIEADGTEAAS
jgi:AcrR family transcriptional regulator